MRITPHGEGYRARTLIRDGAGEPHRIYASGPTQEAAAERLRRKADLIWNGMFLMVDPSTTVMELGELWLRDVIADPTLEQTTKEGYEQVFRSAIRSRIGAVPLGRLSPGVCHQILQTIARERSPEYARSVRRVLSLLLTFAVLHGGIDQNYVKQVPRIKGSGTTYLDLEFDQIVVILDLLRGWRGENPDRAGGGVPDVQLVEDVILLMLGTSMRPGEALALRREDVIFADGRMKIRVAGTVATTKKFGTVRKDTLKRERQKRTITVPSFTADVLRRRLATYDHNPEGLLFPTRRGTARQTNNINRLLRSFRHMYADELIAIGVVPEHLTPRMLRKAAATTIANAADPKLAQLLLGHADVRTTITHYIKPHDEVPDLTAELLDRRYHFGRDG